MSEPLALPPHDRGRSVLYEELMRMLRRDFLRKAVAEKDRSRAGEPWYTKMRYDDLLPSSSESTT